MSDRPRALGFLVLAVAGPLAIVGVALLGLQRAPEVTPAPSPPAPVETKPEPPRLRPAFDTPPQDATGMRDDEPKEPGSVSGRITYESSRRPALSRVALVYVDDERPADPRRLVAGEGTDWTEGQQRFALERTPPGRYLVGISFLDGTVGTSRVVDLAPGADAKCDLHVPAVDVHEDVLVRVVGPDGRDVPGADVQAGFDVPRADVRFGGANDLDAVVRTDEDGTARVHHDAPGAPRNGLAGTERLTLREYGRPVVLTHFIEAASKDFPRTRVVYEPRRDREVTVRFPAPARISVTVEGLPTNPDCDQLRLVLVPRAGGARVTHRYVGDGKFEFDPVVPGDFELRLEFARRDEPVAVVSRQEVTLAAGPRAISIQRGLTLTVVSPDGRELATSSFVLIRVEGGRRERVRTSSASRDGRLVFRGLRAGSYCASCWSKDASGEMTIDVDRDRTTDWRPAAPNALRLEFDDLRKGGVSCGDLFSGDLIVALDGVDCSSGDEPLVQRIERAAGKRWVRLQVIQDGRRVERDLQGGSMSTDCVRPATR